jgi:hypothetical protein
MKLERQANFGKCFVDFTAVKVFDLVLTTRINEKKFKLFVKFKSFTLICAEILFPRFAKSLRAAEKDKMQMTAHITPKTLSTASREYNLERFMFESCHR